MKQSEFEEYVDAIVNKYLKPTLTAKGNDSARNLGTEAEFTSGFEMVAKRLNNRMDTIDVWAVNFEKHIEAIETWINSRKLESEPLENRFMDAINYLILGWGILVKEGIVPDPREDKA
jgi:hypothetical protein